MLFGQPELNRVLARSDMRQLKERITHHFALEPLGVNDIAVYLNFRMRAGGYRGPGIFTPSAVKLIAKVSLGLTRRLNVLADKSLLAAFGENTHQVAPRHVRSAIRDSEFGGRHRAPAWLDDRVARGALAGAALLLALFVFWPKARETTVALPQAPAAQPTPVETSPAPAAPVAAAVAETSPVAAPTAPAAAATALAGSAKPSAPEDKPKNGKFGAKTSERIAATELWLSSAGEERWFIQLLATEARSADKIENFVAQAVSLLGSDQLRVYVAEVQGNQRVGVIYGDYPSREAALTAAAQLPEPLRILKPFPRKVKWLR